MSRNNRGRGGSPSGHLPTDGRAATGVDRDKPYVFNHKGKVYRLPPASKGAELVSFGTVMDVVEDGGDLAQMRLGIATLRASGVDRATLDAIRDKGMTEASRLIGDWMRRTGSGSPGESSGSSA